MTEQIDLNYCDKFSYVAANMKVCVSCMERMNGVYSYEIRLVCKQCGGEHLP